MSLYPTTHTLIASLSRRALPSHTTSRTADLPLESILECVTTPDDASDAWSTYDYSSQPPTAPVEPFLLAPPLFSTNSVPPTTTTTTTTTDEWRRGQEHDNESEYYYTSTPTTATTHSSSLSTSTMTILPSPTMSTFSSPSTPQSLASPTSIEVPAVATTPLEDVQSSVNTFELPVRHRPTQTQTQTQTQSTPSAYSAPGPTSRRTIIIKNMGAVSHSVIPSSNTNDANVIDKGVSGDETCTYDASPPPPPVPADTNTNPHSPLPPRNNPPHGPIAPPHMHDEHDLAMLPRLKPTSHNSPNPAPKTTAASRKKKSTTDWYDTDFDADDDTPVDDYWQPRARKKTATQNRRPNAPKSTGNQSTTATADDLPKPPNRKRVRPTKPKNVTDTPVASTAPAKSTARNKPGPKPKATAAAEMVTLTDSDDDFCDDRVPVRPRAKRPKPKTSAAVDVVNLIAESGVEINTANDNEASAIVITCDTPSKHKHKPTFVMPLRRPGDVAHLVKHVTSDVQTHARTQTQATTLAITQATTQTPQHFPHLRQLCLTWQEALLNVTQTNTNTEEIEMRLRNIFEEIAVVESAQCGALSQNDDISSLLAMVTCIVYGRAHLDSDVYDTEKTATSLSTSSPSNRTELVTEPTTSTGLSSWHILGHAQLPAHCFVSCTADIVDALLAADTHFILHEHNLAHVARLLQWKDVEALTPAQCSYCSNQAPRNLLDAFAKLSDHRARLMWLTIALYRTQPRTIDTPSFCYVWRFLLTYGGDKNRVNHVHANAHPRFTGTTPSQCDNNNNNHSFCSVLAALCEMPDALGVDPLRGALANVMNKMSSCNVGTIHDPRIQTGDSDENGNSVGTTAAALSPLSLAADMSTWLDSILSLPLLSSSSSSSSPTSCTTLSTVPMPWAPTIRLYHQLTALAQSSNVMLDGAITEPQPLNLGRLERHVAAFPHTGSDAHTCAVSNTSKLQLNFLISHPPP